MKNWQITTEFPSQRSVVHRVYGESLSLGSFPSNDFRLPQPCPRHLLMLEAHGNGLKVKTQDHSAKVEVKKNKVECFWDDIKITIELTEDHSTDIADKITSKKKTEKPSPTAWLLWHIVDGRLLESYPLSTGDGRVAYELPVSGFKFTFDSFARKIVIIKAQGDLKSLQLEPHGESLRVAFDRHTILMTPQEGKEVFETLPLSASSISSSKDHFWPLMMLVLGFWIAFVAYLQRDLDRIELADAVEEKLAPENNKITIEKKKERASGQQGGGGVENAKANDPRGGSGYVDEVLVQDRNVLASQPGVLTAFANLDKAMKASSNAVGAGVFGGQNRAQGILKALGGMMGSGGGGTGIGGVGTKGFGGGGGGGVGTGYGKGTGSGVGKGEGDGRQLAFEEGGVSIMGGLEKSEINAVVEEHFAQIRYCYNKGLRTNPSLKGKVISRFVVEADGRVSTSKIGSSTLLNPMVENCISGRIATWQFPKPRGGGQVSVNYPFLLNKS
ncbi:MAG: AgmX/PglI C-terminal domain-containing protein [Proteobacteria bacterium]|nr:AgmX/PglI C-terminal domain-containing protein [Pseudomonadota bacterium]